MIEQGPVRRVRIFSLTVGIIVGLTLVTSCGGDSNGNGESPSQPREEKGAQGSRARDQTGDSTTEQTATTDNLPQPGSSLKDLPPSEERQLARAAKRARTVKPSLESGCVEYRLQGSNEAQLGPPAPRIEGRIEGSTVVVTYVLPPVPKSVACRPFAIEISVVDERKRQIPETGVFRISGTQGQEIMDIPPRGSAIVISARTATLAGLRSRTVSASVN